MQLTPKEQAEYAEMRRGRALTLGSEWVFFGEDDDELVDPWSAEPIRIVEASVDPQGEMLLTAEVMNEAIRPSRRTVKYSELW